MIGLLLIATVVVYNIIVFKEDDKREFSRVTEGDEDEPHLFI